MIAPPALALALELAFTAPDHCARADTAGRIVECSGGDTLTTEEAFEVWSLSQSRTWRDSSATMEADPGTFARLWPAVRAEAAPHLVSTFPAAGIRGAVRLFLPGADPAAVYFVTTRARSGRRSCWSALAWLIP